MKENILHTIISYLSDKLSNKERHNFEKEVNADPFLQDAMDGYAKFQDIDFEKDLLKLNDRLANKTQTTKTRQLIPFFKIAASIIVLIGITSLVYQISMNQLSKSNLAKHSVLEETMDSVSKENNEQASSKQTKYQIIKDKHSQQAAGNKNHNGGIEISDFKPKASEPIVEKDEPQNTGIEDDLIIVDEMEDAELDMIAISDIPMEEEAEVDEVLEYTVPARAIAVMDSEENKTDYTSVENMPTMAATPGIVSTNNILSGKIINSDSSSIPFANVINKNTNETVLADEYGYFNIMGNASDTIAISYIGYKETEAELKDIQSNNNEIVLEPDLLSLEEIAVIGYGVQKETDVTGSVSSVEAESIEQPIQGRVAGVATTSRRTKASKSKSATSDYSKAMPINGFKKFEKYVEKNKMLNANMSINVQLTFIVDSNGSISDIKIIESPDDKYSDEAIRLLTEGPEWLPLTINGQATESVATIIIVL